MLEVAPWRRQSRAGERKDRLVSGRGSLSLSRSWRIDGPREGERTLCVAYFLLLLAPKRAEHHYISELLAKECFFTHFISGLESFLSHESEASDQLTSSASGRAKKLLINGESGAPLVRRACQHCYHRGCPAAAAPRLSHLAECGKSGGAEIIWMIMK